ncbi:ORF6N domain-containing protein [Pedobacter nyackensis]|uniref:ORF6N domain-containing protein n=1 Tax=Pedobacter nyackensis TaxID=475255 RepID=UPI00292F46BC|nr:ORF6N domain-containing protein [Pedobacter nyackensis]
MTKLIGIPDEVVLNKIYIIRDQKIMLDSDLAELYGVETKQLKRQVKRNMERFPHDFMFEMSPDEYAALRCQIGTSNEGRGGLRYMPFCFTEQGVAMLSSVLNSNRAIQVNIHIIRVYTKLRELLLAHKDVFLRVEQVEKQMMKQDQKIELLFTYLSKFVDKNDDPRVQIGYKVSGKP